MRPSYPYHGDSYTGEVLWQLPKSNFTVSAQTTVQYNEFQNCTFRITYALISQGANGLTLKQLGHLF